MSMHRTSSSLVVALAITIAPLVAHTADTTGGIRSILSGDADEDAQLTHEELCDLQQHYNDLEGVKITPLTCDNADGQVPLDGIQNDRIRAAMAQNNRNMKRITEKLKEVTDRPVEEYKPCKAKLLQMASGGGRPKLPGPLGDLPTGPIPFECPEVQLTFD